MTTLVTRVMSDLHLDFSRSPGSSHRVWNRGEDILILAGDMANDRYTTVNFLQDYMNSSPTTSVLFVTGNHDYYGSSIEEIDNFWSDYDTKHPNFHFLQNTSITIGDTVFFGTTLWTDIEKGNAHAKHACAKGINDFRCIRYKGVTFNPDHCIELHEKALQALDSVLTTEPKNLVVITHHLPSYQSIDVKYIDSPVNAAFCSDLEHYLDGRIKIWIHGHTHSSHDYNRMGTRVICNPRGYVKDTVENSEYNNNMIL